MHIPSQNPQRPDSHHPGTQAPHAGMQPPPYGSPQQGYPPPPNPQPYGYHAPYQPQPEVPEATAALVLGIVSIVMAGMPLVGIICGTLGMKKGKRAVAWANQHGVRPGSAEAGRVCGLIGLILGILMSLFWIAYIGFFAWMISGGGFEHMDEMNRRNMERMKQYNHDDSSDDHQSNPYSGEYRD